MIIFGNRAHYAAIGGVENSIRSMFRIVSKQQGQAIVVCREPVKDEPMDLASMTLPLGIELATYRDDYDQSSLRRLRFMRHGGEALPKLYRNLYNRFPEATIIVRHHMHVLAASHAGFRDIRYLVPSMTINQLREELPSSPTFKKLNTLAHMLLDGWLQSRALSKAKLFVLSVSMQEQVQQRLRGRYKADSINIVKPGVDHLRFMPPSIDDKRSLRQQLGLPLEQKLFLFVGRFVQAKGLDYLLDAFVTQASNCSIVLVGEGECEDAIRGKIKSLKIQDRALLVGRTSKVEDFYRASDVFVMSSTYEPFGQTILEAAACGMRIAAYGSKSGVVTATHELNLGGIISYADKLDARSLAQAMSSSIKSIRDPRLDATAKSVSQLYSWKRLLDRLIE